MNIYQVEALKFIQSVFHFLDGVIAEDGVYLYLGLVWLSVALVAWIFSGGLRRKIRHQPQIKMGIGIMIQPSATPPPQVPIIIHEPDDDFED